MATTAEVQTAEIQVAALLGGRKVLGGISEAAEFVEAVRNGLPYASLEALTETLQADLSDVGAVVGIASRTLARRKHEKQLSPIESDRLYRVAYVLHLAASTLGGVDKARIWLQRSNRALGGVAPLSLLDTEIGERKVEETLVQLNHGIYA
jgi:putative toxin-antitoxin system antitoxin component (TIGR02293 family)